MHKPKRFTAAVVGAFLAPVVAACGSSTHAQVTPAARLVPVQGSAAGKIVLTAVGAQRIGLTTATARQLVVTKETKTHGRRLNVVRKTRTVIIPASAVIYDPSGKTYAFVSVGHLTYTEVPVAVAYVRGNSAYLHSGPHAGARVVTVGAEELYGVQTGVLGQT